MQGLIPTIQEELSDDAEHRRCARHTYHTQAKKQRGEERVNKFYVIAQSSFNLKLKDTLKESSKLGNVYGNICCGTLQRNG